MMTSSCRVRQTTFRHDKPFSHFFFLKIIHPTGEKMQVSVYKTISNKKITFLDYDDALTTIFVIQLLDPSSMFFS